MRALLICLCLICLIGCTNKENVSREEVNDVPPPANKKSEIVALQPAVPEQRIVETAEPQRTAYEEYVNHHDPHALVVQRDQPFMLNKNTPLTIAGQPVHYWGVDEYRSLVIQYEQEHSFSGRTVRNPIILPAKVSAIAGTPNRVVCGDTQVGTHTLHILSATDTECRYAVEVKQE